MTGPTVTEADIEAAKTMLAVLCAPMTDFVLDEAAGHFAVHREAAEQARDKAALAWLDGITPRMDHIEVQAVLTTLRNWIATGKHMEARNG